MNKKKKNKKNKIKFIIILLIILLITCILGALMGVVLKKSSPVTIPVIDKQYTDEEDTIIEINGKYYTFNINFNRGSGIGSGGNTDDTDDSGGGSGGGSGTGGGGTPIPVDEVKKQVYNHLKGLGYDDEMIAGIMGNMNPESGILYGTTQGHKHDNYTNAQCVNRGCIANEGTGNAHGLCQWDGGRRNKLINGAMAKGVEWTDGNWQLEFMDSEIFGGYYTKWVAPANIMNGYDSATMGSKVEYVTYRWCRFYEVCAGVKQGDTYASRTNYSHWADRLSSAGTIYEQIKNGEFN